MYNQCVQMRETEFRILDTLSRDIGNPGSIRKITEKINGIHGSAHYPGVYSKIQELAKKKIIHIDKYGKSSVASLNFGNPLLIDSLAQVELIGKVRFLEGRRDWQTLILQLGGYLREYGTIGSILMINPETNARLNRIEFFILLRSHENKKELAGIRKTMGLLQRIHNIRIDCLMLDEASFGSLLRREDYNPVKGMMSDKIAIFCPQTFWLVIKNLLDRGIRVKVQEEPVLPTRISQQDIAFNLARFGYKEMGVDIVQGKPIGIEHLAASILIKKDSIRRLEAIPIIFAKNTDSINCNLLVFLASKFKVTRQLYMILKILDAVRPTKEVKQIMGEIKEEAVQKTAKDQRTVVLNLKEMTRKMRLYNAIE